MYWNVAELTKCSHLLLHMESRQVISGDDHPPASGRQVWTFYSQQNYLEGSWRGINCHDMSREATVLSSGLEVREISAGALGRGLRQILWCREELSSQNSWKGSWHGIGTQTRSVGYLWACGISSRCPWPRGFSWANRTLCTFPTTAMCAQAFSILLTYLAKERAVVVSRQLLLQPTAFWFSTQPLIFPQCFVKTKSAAVCGKEV